jgi:hypothetical protein
LRPSTQKGGTIIFEDVTDLATHEGRLCDPDGYRPAFCPNCLGRTLHVHDYRERVLYAQPGRPVIEIVRHECVSCEAIWQSLPIFLARYLWRSWAVVERVVMAEAGSAGDGRWPPVPARTQRRWRARWLRPARFLTQVLAASGEALWARLGNGLATCADLVAALAATMSTAAGHLLEAAAALIYRLQPKVRLM